MENEPLVRWLGGANVLISRLFIVDAATNVGRAIRVVGAAATTAFDGRRGFAGEAGCRLLAIVVVCLAMVGCEREAAYPSRPITLVCPWAAGGGTDRVSRQMAAHLETELGVPVNVINATGGKGVTGHSRGLDARPDGYTLSMITLELNMMHWSGLTRLTPDDCIPLMSVNEDYAALFVRGDAPWQTLPELEQAIREQPGRLKASGTASGGAWHLALAGWLLAANFQADDVVWVSSTGAGPSLQELLSGGLDMVCCSLPEAESLFRAGELRALGVMSPERVEGYEKIPTFVEQGTDWTLGGWRGLAFPLGTPEPRVERMTAAILRVVRGETAIRTAEGDSTFPDFMRAAGFNNEARGPDEFRRFMAENDEKFGRLLTSEAMRSVNVDRFSPMTFPNLLLALFGATLVSLGVQRWGQRRATVAVADEAPRTSEAYTTEGDLGSERLPSITIRGRVSFVLVVVAVLAYVMLVETVGFVLMVAGLLAGLMVWFRVRPWVALLIGLAAAVIVYQVFANVLRVPLPGGWLGW
ncbi:MAG: tripartite tricarboxylate transporter substrate-binding protein [Pirellulaceae bacterium]